MKIKSKAAEKWVKRALPNKSKKEKREFLKYLYVKNGMIYASNGHLMHFAPTDLPDGVYDKNLNIIQDTDNWAFKFLNVIPRGESNAYSQFEILEHDTVIDSIRMMVKDESGCVTFRVNEKYWSKAKPVSIEIYKGPTGWETHYSGPICFKSALGGGVIMTMRD
jgi:hypothetical protein